MAKKKHQFIMKHCKIYIIVFVVVFPTTIFGQPKADSLLSQATLENCIHYALKNNPAIKNSVINEAIVETTIKSKLSEWYPQINFTYNLQDNFQLPKVNINGNIINSGTFGTSSGQLALTQNIFSSDALLASRSAKDVRIQAKQSTKEQNINLAAMVSKAFYDVILTKQQILLAQEDITRLEQSLKDASYQYQAGITDKTDYKRATISLNNAKALKKTGDETLKAKNAYLKELMSYPDSLAVDLVYDTTQLSNEIYIDTLQSVKYDNRIEINLLETQRKLQEYNLKYYKWSYLPSVSAFGDYNLNYLNNNFSKLYSVAYPNSYAGLLLTLPIFQGGKRIQQIKQAQLEIVQVDNSIKSLQNNINTQYQQALAVYKSNLYNYLALKENVGLAREVYDVISYQYRNGVKTYLDVITAETDLRTAQTNYYNSLYQLLSSKIDVLQSLGNITY